MARLIRTIAVALAGALVGIALSASAAQFTKNSGGSAVAAKLKAARWRKIPVLMWQRPELPAADAEFGTVEIIAVRLGC